MYIGNQYSFDGEDKVTQYHSLSSMLGQYRLWVLTTYCCIQLYVQLMFYL